MIDDALSRRTFLLASSNALAWAWLAAEPGAIHTSLLHAARARASAPAGEWQFFTPDQAADVGAMMERIIPTDDLPGAREAGAIYFFDHALVTWAVDQQEPLRRGLAELNRAVRARWPTAASFTALTTEQQIELLHVVDQTPFFQLIRFATVAGTFANPSWGGNRDKVGWRILGFEDRFVWEPPFGAYDGNPGGGK